MSENETDISESNNMLAVIERASANPAVDVEKMRALLDMQKEIVRYKAEMAFTADFAAMQQDLPVIEKNGEIKVAGVVRSKYPKFEEMNEIVKPILRQYGFAILFKTTSQKGEVTVTGTLMHREGHKEMTELTLDADTSGSKNSVQSIGSSLQYAKRYIEESLLNLSRKGEDDDGARAATEFISEDQAATLIALIEEVGKDKKHDTEVFCKYFKIDKVASLPAAKYPNAVQALEKKRKAA